MRSKEYREYQLRYYKEHKVRQREVARKSINKPENRERRKKAAREYYHKNKERIRERKKRNFDPVKYKARERFKYAVRSGKIKRLPCEVCGDVKSQGHHTDYTKPLDVRWLCHIHHREAHRIK